VLTLKTDKATRHYCASCRSQLIVQIATEELSIAVCPWGNEHRYHEHIRIENPLLKLVECLNCQLLYKTTLYLIGDIERGAVITCGCGGLLKPTNGHAALMREARRIFGKEISGGELATSDSSAQNTPGVIVRCPDCRSLNRVLEAPRGNTGSYSCGRCKRSLRTEAPLACLSTSDNEF